MSWGFILVCLSAISAEMYKTVFGCYFAMRVRGTFRLYVSFPFRVLLTASRWYRVHSHHTFPCATFNLYAATASLVTQEAI